MLEDGSSKEDLKLPEGDDDLKLAQEIKTLFEDGKYKNCLYLIEIYSFQFYLHWDKRKLLVLEKLKTNDHLKQKICIFIHLQHL